MRTFRIASRGSALARWQADHVAAALRALDAGFEVEVRIVRTTGDRITDVPLAQIGDRGLFTREVDDHVLRGDADAAVHSLKDLPTTLAAGLAIGAIMRREDPRDALVFGDPRIRRLEDLARGSTIGTSSLRRRAQLLAARPDLRILDVRGNVDTRLRSLDGGAFDAIVLAAAGLHRLGLRHRIGAYLEPPDWLPAVGQGALAVTCAAGGPAEAVLRPLAHAATASAVLAERAFLRALEGGCQVPIGALAEVHGGDLRLDGMVAALDGARVVRGDIAGAADEAERLGGALARRLSEQGAASLLAEARAAAAAPAD
ncbi:MAG TPA: hydroxymethylbilane synthase [Longimicrobiales bacterium]|nr:hydroxymethylbilane synthase [Longimicrobiales bacterium]